MYVLTSRNNNRLFIAQNANGTLELTTQEPQVAFYPTRRAARQIRRMWNSIFPNNRVMIEAVI